MLFFFNFYLIENSETICLTFQQNVKQHNAFKLW